MRRSGGRIMVSGRVLAIVLCKAGIHDTYKNGAGSYYCIRCGKTWPRRTAYIEDNYDMSLPAFCERFDDEK